MCLYVCMSAAVDGCMCVCICDGAHMHACVHLHACAYEAEICNVPCDGASVEVCFS